MESQPRRGLRGSNGGSVGKAATDDRLSQVRRSILLKQSQQAASDNESESQSQSDPDSAEEMEEDLSEAESESPAVPPEDTESITYL